MRGFIGERCCTHPFSSSPFSLVQPIRTPRVMITFWCSKDGLVIFCTITNGRRAEWGEWWSSLGHLVYFWDRTGLGNLLWLWNSSLSSHGDGRSLHSHPGCSVSLRLPTRLWEPVLSGFRVCGGMCWWIFVSILKHGSWNWAGGDAGLAGVRALSSVSLVSWTSSEAEKLHSDSLICQQEKTLETVDYNSI